MCKFLHVIASSDVKLQCKEKPVVVQQTIGFVVSTYKLGNLQTCSNLNMWLYFTIYYLMDYISQSKCLAVTDLFLEEICFMIYLMEIQCDRLFAWLNSYVFIFERYLGGV